MTIQEEEKFDGMKKSGPDMEIEHGIARHCEKFSISPIEAIKLYPILTRRQWLKRILAHGELFKKTLDVPGDIVELGVFRGAGLFTWANLLECYQIGNRTKTVYGFDNWTGFTELANEDGEVVDELQKNDGGFSPASYYDELLSAIELFDKDRFVPWKPRIKLVKGDIEDSAKQFMKQNPGVRFSFIHFDCDLFNPTLAALEAFYPSLSRGGVMIFDEYAQKEWPGETKAVDDYFSDKPEVQLKTLTWTNTPTAYLIKP